MIKIEDKPFLVLLIMVGILILMIALPAYYLAILHEVILRNQDRIIHDISDIKENISSIIITNQTK